MFRVETYLEGQSGSSLYLWDLLYLFLQLKQNPRSNSRESAGKLQITWDNPKELEVYIGKLQSAAERLSTENRKLRKWHTDFTEKVLTCWPFHMISQTHLTKSKLNQLVQQPLCSLDRVALCQESKDDWLLVIMTFDPSVRWWPWWMLTCWGISSAGRTACRSWELDLPLWRHRCVWSRRWM